LLSLQGTALDMVEGQLRSGGREPLLDKGVLCSLYLALFGTLAVSRVVFPEDHDKLFKHVFTDYYDAGLDPRDAALEGAPRVLNRDYGRAPHRRPRDKLEWLRNFVFDRVTAAWTVLSNLYVCARLLRRLVRQ
jgi:hypothetical protein